MTTTATPNTRTLNQAADQKMIDGFNKHASTITSLVIAGATYKTADILAIFQGRMATANTVETAKPPWQAAVKADKDERAKTKAFVSGVRQSLQVMFAGSVDMLADFGLKPRKPHVVSPDTKAAAALKAKATREARNTMGKVQKAKIKGNVTITPATATPTPTSTSTPTTTTTPTDPTRPTSTSAPTPTRTQPLPYPRAFFPSSASPVALTPSPSLSPSPSTQ